MDHFVSVYATAALWSATDPYGVPMDEHYDIYDLAPMTVEAMTADCDRFRDLTDTVAGGPGGRGEHDLAYGFWMTRNRYGTGFCDGGWPEPMATELTEIARMFPEVVLYVGVDGLIYQH